MNLKYISVNEQIKQIYFLNNIKTLSVKRIFIEKNFSKPKFNANSYFLIHPFTHST
jgi:hypothetical protein